MAKRSSNKILHHDESAFIVDVDVETGTSDEEEVLHTGERTKRINLYRQVSHLVESETELHHLNQKKKKSVAKTEAKTAVTNEKKSRGLLRFWKNITTAKEHGGDCSERFDAAIRAALGTLAVYGILVFPEQEVLGSAWIANLFMHANLKDSFGASLVSFRDLAAGITLTTITCYPFAMLLRELDTDVAQILFPAIIVILTFLIMSCPYLTANNIMVAVMQIVLSPVVHNEIEYWRPFGSALTLFIGIAVAVLMNVIPTPNLAVRDLHKKLNRFEQDFAMLHNQARTFADNASEESPVKARGAIASIEMLYHRIAKTAKELKAIHTGALIELRFSCRGKQSRDKLKEWINQTEKLLVPLGNLRSAVTQRVLGEDHHVYNSASREAKGIIGQETRESRNRMFDAMISTIAMLNAEVDVASKRHIVLPAVQKELRETISEFRADFYRAVERASQALLQSCRHEILKKNTSMPVFAHLTRRMVSFTALLELAESLLHFLEQPISEAEEDTKEDKEATKSCTKECCKSWFPAIEEKWHFHDPDRLRLALKTAVGMFFGSLFISVPYLYDTASPFAAWPGLTIASVSLASTGSSFKKAQERLYGTLFAAGYALLVSNLFPGSDFDGVKIPAITIFTFAAIYIQNKEHSYAYMYAAFSAGAMLFGGDENGYEVSGLIPKRIELIFAGVVIFSFVELLLFPRSSRDLVERQAIQVFEKVLDFSKQAATSADLIRFQVDERRIHREDHSTDEDHSAADEDEDPYGMEKLVDLHSTMKTLTQQLASELGGAAVEPNFGFGLPLDTRNFQALVSHAQKTEQQARLIVKSLEGLADCSSRDLDCIRLAGWPDVYAKFLRDVAYMATFTCEKLLATYPDQHLRPQKENSAVQAVITASSFRQFHDVRLQILSQWSNQVFANAIGRSVSENVDMVSVITISIATTYILEFCREIQYLGKSVEEIAHNFPPAH